MSYDTIVAKSSSIIFRPGIPSSDLSVASWAEIKSFISLREGAVTVFIDSSIAAAMADVGVTDCEGRVLFRAAQSNAITPHVLTLPDGAVLRDPAGFIFSINVILQGTTTPNFDMSSGATFGALAGAQIDNQGTQPAVRVGPASGGNVFSCTLGGRFIPTSGPALELTTPGQTAILVSQTGGTYTGDDVVQGPAGTTLVLVYDAGIGQIPANPGFAGTVIPNVVDQAQFMAYSPAAPADWPIVPSQVAQALDELAGEIGNGSPDTMAYFDAAGKLTGTASFITVDPVNGFVFFNATASDHGSSARVQNTSLIANGSQFRSNQYGNNAGVPGLSTFKSRGATVGSLVGLLAGDPIVRITSVGVAPDDASIPIASFITVQVPASFVPAGQNWLPSEFELQLVPLAGPINSRRTVFKVSSEGETETLRGVRAGGPSTLPASLTTGTLWSSDAVNPNGVITGSPGDLFSDTSGGAGATFWIKETGVATNTGWVAVTSASMTTEWLGVPLDPATMAAPAPAQLPIFDGTDWQAVTLGGNATMDAAGFVTVSLAAEATSADGLAGQPLDPSMTTATDGQIMQNVGGTSWAAVSSETLPSNPYTFPLTQQFHKIAIFTGESAANGALTPGLHYYGFGSLTVNGTPSSPEAVTGSTATKLAATKGVTYSSLTANARRGIYDATYINVGVAQVGPWLGNAANVGGFLFRCRFAITGLGDTSALHAMFGLVNALGATSTDWVTDTTFAKIGLAFSCTTTAGSAFPSQNWQMMEGAAGGSVTAHDLGSGFALTLDDFIEVILYATSNASAVSYTVNNLTTGATTSGTLNTTLPSSTTFLLPYAILSSVTSTSGTNAMKITMLYLETFDG